MFFLQQNQRTRGQNWCCLYVRGGEEGAQLMYTHVRKCKNDKIKKEYHHKPNR
jgi:hypothetical protein